MLIYDTVKQSDAIEKYVTEPMSKLKPEPCNQELTMLILTMLSQNNQITISDGEKPFLFKLIEKRLSLFSFTIKDDRLIILLAYVSETAGKSILYLWYLQWWCKKNNVVELNLDKACTEVFPWGFFKDEDLKLIWEGQKVLTPNDSHWSSDNLIDYASAGFSIQF